MPIYIATVYATRNGLPTLPSVVRDEARDADDFKDKVTHWWIVRYGVMAAPEFGPVSLSKQQVITHTIPVMEKD